MGKRSRNNARKVTSDLRDRGSSAKREFRQRLKWLFGNACITCGYNKTNKALEFHHINPDEKRYTVSQGVKSHDWQEVVQEALKCILVCANCHREIEDELRHIDEEAIKAQQKIIKRNLNSLPGLKQSA